ncbi:MAG: septum formation inhibitor Maf [Candidatus Nitronauta litoralis]|uniref:dTTP/UTP pyrophosphatase n=1 Tax=Candidatus Nitronauta litoralis TaxID=2705533 RepID=A0A7T0BUA8_9BACT|nr:MAG: septum formation inhibitor Maf [Candidatus Nitronauta litoralis]
MKLILASKSPRRSELLTQAGITFEVVPAEVDEITDPNLPIHENIKNLAALKAKWVANNNPDAFVLGADTVVVLDNQIIGKPRDRQDARQILSRLSGNEHQVVTGYALISPDSQIFSDTVTSAVSFHKLNQETIEDYIESGEPMDKAGAYAIQGLGKQLIKGYEGSYTNIVGLPVDEILHCLKNAGFTV